MASVKGSHDIDLDSGTISIAQAARLLKVTDARLRQLQKQGRFPRQVSARVSLLEAVHAFLDSKAADSRQTSASASQSELQRAKTMEVNLRVAREQGRLCDVERTKNLIADAFGMLRSELSGVAAASTRDLAIRDRVADNIEQAIGRARGHFVDQIERLRAAKGRLRGQN